MATVERAAFLSATCNDSLHVEVGDLLDVGMPTPGRVTVIEECEWRFSRKPQLRLTTVTLDGDEVVVLLHPDRPDGWPRLAVLHEQVCRCGAFGWFVKCQEVPDSCACAWECTCSPEEHA